VVDLELQHLRLAVLEVLAAEVEVQVEMEILQLQPPHKVIMEALGKVQVPQEAEVVLVKMEQVVRQP
jgi:hypothetical protein